MTDRPEAAEANRLYWDTEISVADIAAQLDLSRRALYEAVQPMPVGVACNVCGQDLQYENRSARRSATASCSSCGATQDLSEEAIGDEAVPPLAVMHGNARSDARAVLRDPDIRQRAVLLGGAAIAGVAIGTMAALFAMRRD